jgi:hypothetical protein
LFLFYDETWGEVNQKWACSICKCLTIFWWLA